MSSPFITTLPAVGSISRVSRRTSVDLPEPDRPMTTNTSPGATSNETSLTPTTQPVFSFRSDRERSASGVPMILSPPGPKIFQRLSTIKARAPVLGGCCSGGGLSRGHVRTSPASEADRTAEP